MKGSSSVTAVLESVAPSATPFDNYACCPDGMSDGGTIQQWRPAPECGYRSPRPRWICGPNVQARMPPRGPFYDRQNRASGLLAPQKPSGGGVITSSRSMRFRPGEERRAFPHGCCENAPSEPLFLSRKRMRQALTGMRPLSLTIDWRVLLLVGWPLFACVAFERSSRQL